MFIAKLAYCEAEENNHEKGCIPGTRFDKSFDLEFTANSKEGLVRKIKSFLDVEGLEKDGNYYRTARMETAEGHKAYDSDIEKWKKGSEKMWYVEYGFKLYRATLL